MQLHSIPLNAESLMNEAFESISIDFSHKYVNILGSIRINREFELNESNTSDLADDKDDDPRIAIFAPMLMY
jgi:hypothetical protein